MSQILSIENVTKRYGTFTAIKNITLKIEKGEFFTLLGPSGCGKTTLLRMIAGFNTIEEGEIKFGSTVINGIPAHQRNTGMVFQNYAIFPHLTVFENVAYGLKARNLSKKEITRQVEEVLDLVKMGEYIQRQPSKLSGGQQQRVALARAIVIKPEVLLMDEPLSNLDAKLRVEMRSVIKKIQQNLGITTVYVTHDQEEALAISDRIAVMNLGTIQQMDDPFTIYTRPKNTFVSNFIGTSTFLNCTVTGSSIQVFDSSFTMRLGPEYTGKAVLAIRPEEVRMVELEDGILTGRLQFVTFLGDFINYEVILQDGSTIQINEYLKDTSRIRNVGDTVGLTFDTSRVNLFSEDGQESLL
ncbi:MAG TPA: ABC transporter ATP-binding protein [Sphaerochaeta sp.]|nr:ABC transporter ATP-binding protein [Sphaerochaeta sp.]